MINMYEVSETNEMIEHENLDVRTITLGISLLDCIDSDLEELNRKIYDKITETAKDLVSVGRDIEKEFGIPIVNKRISVTPIALVGGAACKSPEDFVTIAKTLDRAADKVGVNFIGGYSALVSKGMTKSDENLIRSIPQALAQTERICSSVNVGSTKTGINMDAVRLCGEIVKATAEETKERDSLGCAKLVIFCNAPDDNPFMAGAFLGVTESDAVINVGVSGPGVVKKALEKVRGKGFEELCETIKKTAFKVTRVGQLVAGEASQRLGIPFGIVDLSLAPTPAIGDSVAEILEEIGLERVGAPGTTAALAMLNDQVKKQFLNIMFKQMKTLKEEEPILFNETLLLMDLNKTPDSLELNEEAALKITATELVESEKTQKKKFHLVDNAYLDSYEATKNDSELMAQIFGEQQNDRVYSVELDEMKMEKPKSKGGKKNDLQH